MSEFAPGALLRNGNVRPKLPAPLRKLPVQPLTCALLFHTSMVTGPTAMGLFVGCHTTVEALDVSEWESMNAVIVSVPALVPGSGMERGLTPAPVEVSTGTLNVKVCGLAPVTTTRIVSVTIAISYP